MVGGNGRKPKPEFFSSFVKGGGAIAVTDPDEWDDLPRVGAYNSFLVSPEITLPAEGAPLFLRFDSSWRPELFDAGNNWWWAIDNIEVTTSLAGVPVTPLVMTSTALDPTTHVAGFRWQSITGRSYTLQYSMEMKLWYPAQTGLIGGPGTETQASLDLDGLFPGRFLPASVFFRIKE